MGFDYRHLFPFEKIPKGSRIVIYGAGEVGTEYLKQVFTTGFCQVVGFIDKNYDKYDAMNVPAYPVERIGELRFDYVVIALKNDHLFPEILRLLREHDVDDNKIVYVFEREEIEIYKCDGSVRDNNKRRHFAYLEEGLSIAFYMVGAFGDAIIQKIFVEKVESLAPDCSIDIYHNKADIYLSTLYKDDHHINELIIDAGALYRNNKDKYTVSFSIRGYFINEIIYRERAEDLCPRLYERIQMVDTVKLKKEDAAFSVAPKVMFLRRIIKGLTCYTGFSYEGVFDIRDYHVHIPLDESYRVAYEKLELKRYITLNFGNGDSPDSTLVAKSWPMNRFACFVELFKQAYPDITVVQVGAKGIPHIPGTDRQIMGESFELVKHILKGALFHFDIEGGLVHLASQLGTKCIVLFGPTDERYLGYERNISVKAGSCHHCYGLYTEINRCARDMPEPECMYSITPELVMKYVDEYMNSISVS